MKRTPISIYLDLSKAFNTLDHNIILSKLDHYGISNVTNNLFKNYLIGRTHNKLCIFQWDLKNI